MTGFFDLNIGPGFAGGFGLFSPGHFAWLAAAAAFCALLCLWYKSASPRNRRLLRLGLALSAMAAELLRFALLLAAGQYGLHTLPLHLCAMTVYLSLLHALRGGEMLGQFLYAFCMPGAVFALIFPDWSYYPLWHFISLSGFAIHILLAAYTLMQVFGGDIRPELRKAKRCLLIMLAVALPVFLFDRLTGTNYMFLNWPSPGSPLERFAFLGRPGYLLGYIPLLLGVWALQYLPFALRRRPPSKGKDEDTD